MPKPSSLEVTFDHWLALLAPDLPTPVSEYVFAPPRKFRADRAWPQRKLLIELDGGVWSGGRHVQPAGFEADAVKSNLATAHGYRVLRFTAKMLDNHPQGVIDSVRAAYGDIAPVLTIAPPTPYITIVEPLTEAEARAKVMQINAHAAEMGRLLLELREREGWRVLGYANWTDCLKREFSYSRKHLYELMSAAPVQERLSPMGYTVSHDAANELARFPVHMQPVIAQAAHVRGGITAGRVKRQGAAITQALTTGYTDTGSGDSIALDAALDLEEQEAAKRRKQYMADNQTPRAYVARSVTAQIVQRGQTSLTIVVKDLDADALAGLAVMGEVMVSIWRVDNAAEAVISAAA